MKRNLIFGCLIAGLFLGIGCNKTVLNCTDNQKKECLKMECTNENGVSYFVLSNNGTNMLITSVSTGEMNVAILRNGPLINIAVSSNRLSTMTFGGTQDVFTVYSILNNEFRILLKKTSEQGRNIKVEMDELRSAPETGNKARGE